MTADINITEKNYKEIRIPVTHEFSREEETLLDNLFANYSDEEVKYKLEDSKFVFFLKALNLSSFESDIKAIKKTGEQKGFDSIITLLNSLLDSVYSIRSYGLKGQKRVYVGYNKERKVKSRKEKETNRGIHYYALDNDFSKTDNPIPQQFINKIICGDSYEVLSDLPDNCIDLVFTSPPYNFGFDYESNNDAHYWEKYFSKLFDIFSECIRVLKFGGRIAVNIQPLFSDYIPTHHIISNFFMSKKMIWKGEILWEKNNYNCKYTAWGSWKSPSSPYLKYTWEFIEIFAKGNLKKEGNSADADMTADEFKKWVVSKWSIAPERNMKEFDHPAMFPEELAKRVLKLFSYQNDIILDPFNGVGTTTLVAKQTNRSYLGIDISPEYCDKARKRLTA